MMLDLSADDGLLVPFHRSSDPVKNEGESLFHSSNNDSNSSNNNSASRGFARFLFSRKAHPDPPKCEEENLPLKETTFAFPKARAEVAESFPEPFKEKEPQDEDSDDDDDDDDESGDEEEDGHDNREKPRTKSATPKPAAPPQKSLRNLDEWDPHENPWYEEKTETRSWRIEGIGNTPAPPVDNSNESKGFVGFWRNLRGHGHRRRADDIDDLRSMKVATEDTKNDKTLLEQIGKAALVVLVPELYADIEDGDENLGMYRSVALNSNDDDAEASSPDTTVTDLRSELHQLRLKVLRLEKALKSSELETNAWKLRCKEVETELRRYKGQCDDDSSLEADDDGACKANENESDKDAEDDGIEEQWSGYSSVKEGTLIDMNEANLDGTSVEKEAAEDLMGDGDVFGTESRDSAACHDVDMEEPDLMDLNENTLTFDPYAK